MKMISRTNKAIWQKAQTYSFMAFFALGAILLGLWMLRGQVSSSYRDLFEGAILVASYLAILSVNPLTNHFYTRLTRR